MLKEAIINIIKIIIELGILIFLVFLIVYLYKYSNGVQTADEYGKAQEKLDIALKQFSSGDDLSLEDALNNIEGVEDLEVTDSGYYTMKIDGYDFFVIKSEIIPEDAEATDENTVTDAENSEATLYILSEDESIEEENIE